MHAAAFRLGEGVHVVGEVVQQADALRRGYEFQRGCAQHAQRLRPGYAVAGRGQGLRVVLQRAGGVAQGELTLLQLGQVLPRHGQRQFGYGYHGFLRNVLGPGRAPLLSSARRFSSFS